MGTGKIEVYMGGKGGGFRNSSLSLSGKSANTFDGTYFVKQGRVLLATKMKAWMHWQAKSSSEARGDNDCLYLEQKNQIKDTAEVTLLDSPDGGLR